VDRDVEQHAVEQHGRARRDLGIVRVLDEREQRRHVLLVVDVAVPLVEAELRLVVEPREDHLARVLAVLVARHAGGREHAIGPRLTGQILERVEDHLVVLRPVPHVVVLAGRGRLRVPELEGEDRVLGLLPELRHDGGMTVIAEVCVQQIEHVEVAGVLEHRELGEGRVPCVGAPRADRRRVAGLARLALHVHDRVERPAADVLRCRLQVREAPRRELGLVHHAGPEQPFGREPIAAEVDQQDRGESDRERTRPAFSEPPRNLHADLRLSRTISRGCAF
jgi:hypothetical protein